MDVQRRPVPPRSAAPAPAVEVATAAEAVARRGGLRGRGASVDRATIVLHRSNELAEASAVPRDERVRCGLPAVRARGAMVRRGRRAARTTGRDAEVRAQRDGRARSTRPRAIRRRWRSPVTRSTQRETRRSGSRGGNSGRAFLFETEMSCGVHEIPETWTSCPFCERVQERVWVDAVITRWRNSPHGSLYERSRDDEKLHEEWLERVRLLWQERQHGVELPQYAITIPRELRQSDEIVHWTVRYAVGQRAWRISRGG